MLPMSAPGSIDLNLPSPTEATTPSSPGHPNKKRKTGPATSRGVASLTPEQLAKKRANDREAQRAIRERTKAQIETLEKKIQELTSQQPYQELQAVIRQKDAIQAENDDIRRRLESVLSIIQPIVTAHGLTGENLIYTYWKRSADRVSCRSCYSCSNRRAESASYHAAIGVAARPIQRCAQRHSIILRRVTSDLRLSFTKKCNCLFTEFRAAACLQTQSRARLVAH